ncbi:MAG: hypothetical protein OEU92_10610 [Alphaproteobacteria bacterium]|nr:hypothetical protein [Alphaproteobacteria bacterium]
MRVGFLFNHYATHQVPHAAPFAFELSRRRQDVEVIIACSTHAEMVVAETIGVLYPGHRCIFHVLGLGIVKRLVDLTTSRWSFKRKRFILERNLDFFRSLDVLVTPERHALRLRRTFGLTDLKIVHTRHGAGDREGGFDERCAEFDFTLLPGQKYVDRLRDNGFLRRHALVGWPKFEVMRALKPKPERLFDNDKPTVVYAPHFDERVSSWQTMGEAVFAFFKDNRDYNLIFAPHVVLFKRRWRHGAKLPRGYRRCPNILIDTGSTASVDMTYMRAADIYLGDVSSQVYEFLLEPRPCIFLNAHKVDWQHDPHYQHFALGQVVDDVEGGLEPALLRAFSSHAAFRPKQEAAIAYTFYDEPGSTAVERGVDALCHFVDSLATAEPATEQHAVLPDLMTAAS